MNNNPKRILRENGKTFYFAGLFLEKNILNKAARLYAFCRYIDDIADKSIDNAISMKELGSILKALESNESSNPRVMDFIHLKNETNIDINAAQSLVLGAMSDLSHSQIKDTDSLIRYCYQVAGTVGVMMCAILRIKDTNAHKFAIDLGMGMQLTNIARDIHEDSAINRLYIPKSWSQNITIEKIKSKDTAALIYIEDASKKLLSLADRYYESGYSGLNHIPQRSRIAIEVAATVYQAIGTIIKSRQHNPFLGRAIVPYKHKVFYALKILLKQLYSRKNKDMLPQHNEGLHLPLNFSTNQELND